MAGVESFSSEVPLLAEEGDKTSEEVAGQRGECMDRVEAMERQAAVAVCAMEEMGEASMILAGEVWRGEMEAALESVEAMEVLQGAGSGSAVEVAAGMSEAVAHRKAIWVAVEAGFGGGGGAGHGIGAGGGGGFGGGGGNGGGGGGFGGGGGSNLSATIGVGGNGGFGGGGAGGGSLGSGGIGGFGGGRGQAGTPFIGGGGMGAGGALFVHSGGTAIIESATFSNNAVAGGDGFISGSAYGRDIFLVSGGNLNFHLTSDSECAAIGGNHGRGGFTATETSGIVINNHPGVTLVLTSAGIGSYEGLFDGILEINGGICSIDSDYCFGYSTVHPSINGGTLATTRSISTARNFSIGGGGGAIQAGPSTTLAFTGIVSGAADSHLTLVGAGATIFSTLAVDSGTFVLAGPFGGSGTVTKTGNGTLFLPADAPSFTGNLEVTAGALQVNGALNNSSQVTLHSNTLLKGIGTVGNIICSGTIAPGNSVGVLNSGSVAFDALSTFQVEIDGSGASLLNVTGIADLAGSVHVVVDVGSSSKSKLLILTATAAITGAFSPEITGSLIGSAANSFRLIQENNNLYLSYQLNVPMTLLSGKEFAIANYLNSNSNHLSSYFIGMTPSEVKRALNRISPASNALGTYVAAQTAFSLSDIVTAQLDHRRFSKSSSSSNSFMATLVADASSKVHAPKGDSYPWTSWVSLFGEISQLDAFEQNPALNYSTEAALLGFDYSAKNGNLVGVSLGYAHSHFSEEQEIGDGNINYYFASLYSNCFVGDFYLSPALWGLFNQIDNVRKISFSHFSQEAKAYILAWQLSPHLEFGYLFATPHCKITPFTSIDWPFSWQKAYTEHGAGGFSISQEAKRQLIFAQ